MSRPLVALDVSPLTERHHTGIANVTKHLAIEMAKDETIDPLFCMNRSVIPADVVEKVTQLDTGNILWWLSGRGYQPVITAADLDRPTIGIYPGMKWQRRLFETEVQIVHDLTTVVTPRFHTADAVEMWQSRLYGDMASSDLIVAVSQSTETDIRTYYDALAHIPSIVVPLAPCSGQVEKLAEPEKVEPYIVVLGTLEPRKNVEFVFDYIAANPGIAERYRFVFVGRFGWGQSIEILIDRHGFGDLVKRRRIHLTGFVSDRVRDYLIAHARLVIYPSRYEGFGLPIIEALSMGVPVLTTISSSLPEVGGRVAHYCDVDDPADFATTIEQVLAAQNRMTVAEAEALAAERKAWSAQFSWQRAYRSIRDAALAIAHNRWAA